MKGLRSIDPSAFPYLLPGERLGDPCPCGCAGVKVTPENPRARKLAVRFLCQDCGAAKLSQSGVYSHHPLRCRPCNDKKRSRDQRIWITCASCGASRDCTPSYLRKNIKKGRLVGAVVNYAERTATYPRCWACSARAAAEKRNADINLDIKEVNCGKANIFLHEV
jgi:transcription elongation factor Elf1